MEEGRGGKGGGRKGGWGVGGLRGGGSEGGTGRHGLRPTHILDFFLFCVVSMPDCWTF